MQRSARSAEDCAEDGSADQPGPGPGVSRNLRHALAIPFSVEKRGSPFPWWWSFWVNFRIHSWKVRIVRPWSSKAPSQLRFWGMGTRPKKMRIGFHCNMKEPQYGPQNEEINYIPPVFSKVFSILGWMRFIFVAILASAKYRGTCFSYFSRAENIDFKDGKLGTRSKQQPPKKLIWGSFGCHEIPESRHHEPVSYQHDCITGIMSIQSIMLGKLQYFTWKVRRGNGSPKSMIPMRSQREDAIIYPETVVYPTNLQSYSILVAIVHHFWLYQSYSKQLIPTIDPTNCRYRLISGSQIFIRQNMIIAYSLHLQPGVHVLMQHHPTSGDSSSPTIPSKWFSATPKARRLEPQGYQFWAKNSIDDGRDHVWRVRWRVAKIPKNWTWIKCLIIGIK